MGLSWMEFLHTFLSRMIFITIYEAGSSTGCCFSTLFTTTQTDHVEGLMILDNSKIKLYNFMFRIIFLAQKQFIYNNFLIVSYNFYFKIYFKKVHFYNVDTIEKIQLRVLSTHLLKNWNELIFQVWNWILLNSYILM